MIRRWPNNNKRSPSLHMGSLVPASSWQWIAVAQLGKQSDWRRLKFFSFTLWRTMNNTSWSGGQRGAKNLKEAAATNCPQSGISASLSFSGYLTLNDAGADDASKETIWIFSSLCSGPRRGGWPGGEQGWVGGGIVVTTWVLKGSELEKKHPSFLMMPNFHKLQDDSKNVILKIGS